MNSSNYKVYIKLDNRGNIIAINSSAFLEDIDGWIFIDEGFGDKYLHVQGNYFENGLLTHDGIPVYGWDGTQVLKRTEEEIENDRRETPPAPLDPNTETQLAVVELAQVVEDNNTANQLAIAELAEAILGGNE